jgi:hypothetical protein
MLGADREGMVELLTNKSGVDPADRGIVHRGCQLAEESGVGARRGRRPKEQGRRLAAGVGSGKQRRPGRWSGMADGGLRWKVGRRAAVTCSGGR